MTTHAFVYIGTYTKTMPHVVGKAKGIYCFEFDAATGRLSGGKLVANVANPTYVAIDSSRRFLYAVSETDSGPNQSGRITAYAIDSATGGLRMLNRRLTGGADPCYLQVDATGKTVVAANYTGGSVASFPLRADGSLGERGSFHQHVGSSINPDRQEAAHAHMARIDASNRWVFVPDLGMDKVTVYQLDAANGKVQPNTPFATAVEAGQGPRHFDIHPSQKFAYVINELGSTVTAFRYDPDKGTLETLQTISTLPAGFTESTCAHVQMHPSGKFLYGSNRGHDSIAIFQVDSKSGKLTAAGHASTQGLTPRNFTIDPSGQFLLAANQDSDTILTFRIDQKSGALTANGDLVACPTPVCLKFL